MQKLAAVQKPFYKGMKINRVSSKNSKLMARKDSFFMNVYYFFCLYRYVSIIIIGIGLSVFLVLLALDYMIPSELDKIDKTATLKLLDQLQQANRHQDAITLMEYKGKMLENSPLELEYKTKLSDSYIHVGDYSKAEKMLLDVWQNSDKYLKASNERILKEYPQIKSFLKFGLARTIYQFYEKIGDKNNMMKFYKVYRSYYDPNDRTLDSLTINIYNDKTWFTKKTDLNHKELVEFDSINLVSLSDKDKAIQQMSKFVDKINGRSEYGAAFKVKCLNKLIGWQLQENQLFDAYKRIAQAVYHARNMRIVDEYVCLGELSDYCFQIHDVKLSKTLYNRYEEYLEARYRKDDFEYLQNYSRKLRYLEAEGDWDKLKSNLIAYCVGMRAQIAQNIPSMTKEQQEYFAKQFDYAYNSAMEALQKHPCDELANLCFDNITFKNGLLLRSNLATKHSIERLNDKHVTAIYNDLVKCRRKLIYASISGRRFFNNKGALESHIDELEKEIALKCTDFKTKNQIEDYQYSKLQKKMTSEAAVVDLVENQGQLFALVLTKKDNVKYIPVGAMKTILPKLREDIEDIYHDPNVTNFFWSKIASAIKDKKTVYYTPIGMFSQLAIGSLYISNNEYLCDRYDLRLLSNPTAIQDLKPVHLANDINMISLWGGIDYGSETGAIAQYVPQKRSAVKRGERLTDLHYTQLEVQEISTMLSEHHIPNKVYSSKLATKKTFLNRSGKNDFILHVSTHGFFNDSTTLSSSMYDSGLFFAGANKYWASQETAYVPNLNDGILRAAEISDMNLAGCSLVILSACETGLGFSESSEGVYGLQRAFKLAGAQQVLMSLWDVDDRATMVLMTTFYGLLLQGLDVDTAFNESKKQVRQQYPSPRDWGAFVLLH